MENFDNFCKSIKIDVVVVCNIEKIILAFNNVKVTTQRKIIVRVN